MLRKIKMQSNVDFPGIQIPQFMTALLPRGRPDQATDCGNAATAGQLHCCRIDAPVKAEIIDAYRQSPHVFKPLVRTPEIVQASVALPTRPCPDFPARSGLLPLAAPQH